MLRNLLISLSKLLITLVAFAVLFSITGCKENFLGLLNPKGFVAYEERKLFFDTLALMLIVVLPVIIMSFTFIYHYQISHRTKDYKPNWSHSYFLESLWWGIPCFIIVILAVMTWKKTHELDPYNRIAGFSKPPMRIEVIGLPWKWLFIYPEQNIATLNYVVVPVGVQVEYWLTVDNVPMSAFFIPQLGSQIYAMAGMRTRLHLTGNEVGVYQGLNSQFNGDGFSDMTFPVYVVEPEKMDEWVKQVKASPNQLTEEAYLQLLKPSKGDKVQYFSSVNADFFQNVINLYMNSVGTSHPRESQANYNLPVKAQEE